MIAKHLSRKLWLSALVLAAVPLLGCGGSNQASVTGKVSFNGQVVDNGTIVFVPQGASEAKKAGAVIQDGKYTLPAEQGPTPGKFKVEISWQKKTGRQRHDPDTNTKVDERREGLPPRFNTQSELFVDLTSGNNQKDFDLKTN